MKKGILISAIALIVILIIGAFTKPSDKEIMEDVVYTLWGNNMPGKAMPHYYEQFMILATEDIHIDDWLFIKRVRYSVNNNTAVIGYAAFGKVMLNK